MKYLGVVIDENLNFKENLEKCAKKMSSKIGFMSRNKKKMDYETRLMLYKCMVAPNIDYCSSILFLNNDTEISILQRIQNRELRL